MIIGPAYTVRSAGLKDDRQGGSLNMYEQAKQARRVHMAIAMGPVTPPADYSGVH